MNVSHLLLPGEDIQMAPARWHYLYRTGKSDESIERMGTSLLGRKPHNLFDSRILSYRKVFSQLGWEGGFANNDLMHYQSAYLYPNEFEQIQQGKMLKCYGNSSTHVKHWRWCAQCVIDDEEHYGIPFYHRDHQLPGVFHCQLHHELLVDKCSSCGWHVFSEKKHGLPPFESICPGCGKLITAYEVTPTDAILSVEKASLALANTPYRAGKLTELQQKVRSSSGISSMGENTLSERKKVADWQRHFFKSFSKFELTSWFRRMQLHKGFMVSPLMHNTRIWNLETVAKPLHPLVYLLVENFLSKSSKPFSHEKPIS